MEKERDAILDAIIVSAVLGILLFPVQFIVCLMAALIMETPYLFFHNLFGFNWSAGGSSMIDIRRFLEFWFTGFGIYLFYIIIYFIVAVICHKKNSRFHVKFRFWLFGVLLSTSLIAILVGDIRRPVQTGLGRLVMPDLGYHIANAFLFAFIMFTTFVFVSIILEKYLKFDEITKVTLAFVISTIVGFLLSGGVWLILFNIFN